MKSWRGAVAPGSMNVKHTSALISHAQVVATRHKRLSKGPRGSCLKDILGPKRGDNAVGPGGAVHGQPRRCDMFLHLPKQPRLGATGGLTHPSCLPPGKAMGWKGEGSFLPTGCWALELSELPAQLGCLRGRGESTNKPFLVPPPSRASELQTRGAPGLLLPPPAQCMGRIGAKGLRLPRHPALASRLHRSGCGMRDAGCGGALPAPAAGPGPRGQRSAAGHSRAQLSRRLRAAATREVSCLRPPPTNPLPGAAGAASRRGPSAAPAQTKRRERSRSRSRSQTHRGRPLAGNFVLEAASRRAAAAARRRALTPGARGRDVPPLRQLLLAAAVLAGRCHPRVWHRAGPGEKGRSCSLSPRPTRRQPPACPAGKKFSRGSGMRLQPRHRRLLPGGC